MCRNKDDKIRWQEGSVFESQLRGFLGRVFILSPCCPFSSHSNIDMYISLIGEFHDYT